MADSKIGGHRNPPRHSLDAAFEVSPEKNSEMPRHQPPHQHDWHRFTNMASSIPTIDIEHGAVVSKAALDIETRDDDKDEGAEKSKQDPAVRGPRHEHHRPH